MTDKILLENSDGSVTSVNEYPIRTAIGFTGSVSKGLLFHSEKRRCFYPLGKSIVLRSDEAFISSAPIIKGQPSRQKFLSQHSHNISALSLSSSGRFLISGEKSDSVHDKSEVIIWNVEGNGIVHGRHRFHFGGVTAVQISPNDVYAASLGKEDPAVLILKNLSNGDLIFGKKAFGQPLAPTCLSFLPERDNIVLVGGLDAIHIWRVSDDGAKLTCTRVAFGKIKRSVSDLFVRRLSNRESFVFCGTKSGDIVKVSIVEEGSSSEPLGSMISCLVKKTSRKDSSVLNAGKFSGGITVLSPFSSPDKMLVGTGCGDLCVIQDRALKPSSKSKAHNPGVPSIVSEPTVSHLLEIKALSLGDAPITSIQYYDRSTIFAGTKAGDVHHIDALTFYTRRVSSSSTHPIRSISFPQGLDSICVSSSADGIRLWELTSGSELLHVTPSEAGSGNACLKALFSPGGEAILSGWSDGSFRVFSPQSGSILGVTGGVHPSGVSALALEARRGLLLSGGKDGQLRAWRLGASGWKLGLACTIRQHKKEILSLEMHSSGRECLSGSADGTVVLWDVSNPDTLVRQRILVCSCSLVGAGYSGSQGQVLTLSLDGRLSYWESLNGVEIRSLIIGHHGVNTALDVSKDYILTGNVNSSLKLRRYLAGDIVGVGRAHVGSISALKVSPSGRSVVVGTLDGAVIVFDV